MSFLENFERALSLGLTKDEYKAMWEAEMKKSHLVEERKVLELRQENRQYQSTHLSTDQCQEKLMDYFQVKFQELREELAWMKKDILETILRQSTKTNEEIEKHLVQYVKPILWSNVIASNDDQLNCKAEENNNVSSKSFSNIDLPNGNTTTQNQSIHNQPYDSKFVDVCHETQDEIVSGTYGAVSENLNVDYQTVEMESEEGTAKYGKSWVQVVSQEGEWQTNGQRVKVNEHNSIRATGHYSELISKMMSQRAAFGSDRAVSGNMLRESKDWDNWDIIVDKLQEFTIKNVKEFFTSKTEVETDYYFTQPLRVKYRLVFRFNGENELEVSIFVRQCDDIFQRPITFECTGQIYNPQSCRYTKLWMINCIVLESAGHDVEHKAFVCLETLRGSHSPVKYDTLAKRHYELHDRFDFKWKTVVS